MGSGTDLGSAHGEVRITYDDSGIGSAMSQLTSLGGLVTSTAALLGTAFVAGAAIAAGALASVAAAGVQMAADLEQQLADITAVMGATGEETEQLKELILDLGLDPNLKVSAEEAAEAIEALGRNGLEVEDILGGAAEATVLLANATGAEFGTAANLATDAMALWNISAEDMLGVVDTLVSVTTSSKFTIEDFALALAQGGGVASAAGVSLDDLAATISAIAPYFASGSDAGTSLKTMLQRLVNPTDQAQEAMQELGLWTEESGNAFYDAEGNMRPMAEVAGLLSDAVADLSEEQRGAMMATIFGSDAVRAATAIAELGAEGFEELAGAMEQTDAAEMAATRMDTLSGAMEVLQGVIDTVKIRIGDAFLPLVRQVAEAVTEFVNEHGDEFIAFFETIADVIGAFVSGAPGDFPWEDIFPDWLADRMYDISGIFEGVVQAVEDWRAGKIGLDTDWEAYFPSWIADIIDGIGTAMQFVTEHAEGFKAALKAIGVVLAGAGILAAIAGLVGLITNLINPITLLLAVVGGLAFAWEENWGGIQDKFLAAWGAIKPGVEELGSILETLGNYFLAVVQDGDSLNGWLDKLPPGVKEVAQVFGEALVTIKDTFGQISEWTSGKGAAIGDWLEENEELIANFMGVMRELGAVVAVLVAIAAVGFATIAQKIAGLWSVAEPILDMIITTILALAEAFMEIITGDWSAAMETFGQLFDDLLPLAAEGGQALLDWLTGWFGMTFEQAVTKVADFMAGLKDKLSSVWEGIVTTVTERVTALRDGILERVASIKASWDEFWGGIGAGIAAKLEQIKGSILNAVRGWFESMGGDFDAFTAKWRAIWEDVKLIATTIWERIKEAVTSRIEELKTSISTAISTLGTTLSAHWETIKTTATEKWDALKAAVETAIDNVVTVVSGLIGRIKTALTNSGLAESGRGLIEQIKTGITSAWTTITTALSTRLDALKTQFESSRFAEIGRNIIAGVLSGLSEKAFEIVNFVTGLAGDVLAGVKEALGIESPSKEFELVGTAITDGLLKGLELGKAGVETVVADILDLLRGGGEVEVLANTAYSGGDGMEYMASADESAYWTKDRNPYIGRPARTPAAGASTSSVVVDRIEVTVNVTNGGDPEEMANAANRGLMRAMRERGLV